MKMSWLKTRLPFFCVSIGLTLLAFEQNAEVQETEVSPPPVVQVMVLGVHHFSNPGLDLHNVKAVNMQSEEKQKELDLFVKQVMAFKPTAVAVEVEADSDDLAISGFSTFTEDDFTKPEHVSEHIQLGYRLAMEAGIPKVLGIDEQPADGEPDYFPFDKVQDAMTEFGQLSLMEQVSAIISRFNESLESKQVETDVTSLMLWLNDDALFKEQHQAYMYLMQAGDLHNQAGADLNAMWFLRNAKIFSKLQKVTVPGDRVVLIFGHGHGYWLRELVKASPQMQLVELQTVISSVQ